jgi:Ca-activated chloride channel homolog
MRTEFAQAWVLWFLLLLPLVFWYYRRREQSMYPQFRFSSLAGIAQARPSWKIQFRWLPVGVRMLAVACVIVALARPQLPMQSVDVTAEGIDIMLSIDVSGSMQAKDFEPNRLEASKKVAADFVDRRPDDRLGLVAFSGESYTACPLTTDHIVLKDQLSQLQSGMLADGTAIGMGLANAVKRLKESDSKSKVVILLTDGVNNGGYTSPSQAAEAAQKLGVRVYTVGVGTRGKARVPVAGIDPNTPMYVWADVQIDEELLQKIAGQTGGQYFRATDMESLEKIYAEIDRLERSKIESTSVRRYEEHFHPWLWAAVLLLATELLLQYTVFKSIMS